MKEETENLSALTLNDEIAEDNDSSILSFNVSVKSSSSISISEIKFMNSKDVDLYFIYGIICSLQKKLESQISKIEKKNFAAVISDT